MEVLRLQKINKSYEAGARVLHDLDLVIQSRELVAILGASGSGKSTLLHIAGLLDRPDSGEIYFESENVTHSVENELAALRLKKIGFVFQFHHLIPELNATENVELPALLAGEQRRARAEELLAWVGLGDKLRRHPWELSGGEQQRIALARALINDPVLLVTDEATGNLDRTRAEEIVGLLQKVNTELGTAVLSATHDLQLATHYHRQLRLVDAKCIEGR